MVTPVTAARLCYREAVTTFQKTNQVILGFKCIANTFKSVNAIELMRQGRPVFLDRILPEEVIAEIEHLATVKEKISSFGNYLLESQEDNSAKRHSLNLVHEVIFNIDQYLENKISLRQLSKEYFVSSKTLTRHFLNCTGLTPKYIFTVSRFRKALKNYLFNQSEFDMCKYGYFDHSHFYREVKYFTGLYPFQILSKTGTVPDEDRPSFESYTI